ncbi:MAG: hypothetical protein AB4058_01810 [Microcystaceae cyanobacterium]
MAQTYPISQTITTFADLKQKFKLSPTDNELFFSEWQQELPNLSLKEKETLDEIKQRFERHLEDILQILKQIAKIMIENTRGNE